MFRLKRKTKKDSKDIRKKILLNNYINELIDLGYSTKQIRMKFEEKMYPDEFIDNLLKINSRRLKMVRKKKKEEEYDEEEYDEENEEEPEEEEPEEDEDEPKKPVKKAKSKKKDARDIKEDTKLSVVDVLQNHDQRLQNIEASMYRLKTAIV